MSSDALDDISINWNRAIFIDEPLTDAYVRRLAPTILKLRQDSDLPITVAIDSPGGSLSTLETLLGFLTGPTQGKISGKIITVATSRAYSAAANLLAFGDYAVALRHAKVLCHDVRFSEVADVTPSKAIDLAKSLQDENDRMALRLANVIIRRLVWVYIELSPDFSEIAKKWESRLKRYKTVLGSKTPIQSEENQFVDIPSFATALYSKISYQNDSLIDSAMTRLGSWSTLTVLSNTMASYRAKGQRTPGLLDGLQYLHKQLKRNDKDLADAESDLKLFLTLVVSEINGKSGQFTSILDEAVRNFVLIKSMNDKKHRDSALRLMLQYPLVFFGKPLDGLPEDDRKQLIGQALPFAQLFWLFCVSLCRELFEGEHVLSPSDAQLLGLINEVAGGGAIESYGEWKISKEKAPAPAAT